MDYALQLERINTFVTAFFEKHPNPALLYHNYAHTTNVVKRAKEIASNYPVTPKDMFVLIAAAWFHDTGQLLGSSQNHEEVSAAIMKDYFATAGVDRPLVEPVKQCILATKLPHQPISFLDEIICDADTYNLGTDEFPVTDALLKRECELRSLPTADWEQNTLELLLQHRYFTSYCRERLEKTKNANIELVRRGW